MKKITTYLFLILFFAGCSIKQVGTSKKISLTKDKSCVVGPFYNYTQTPLAGYRAASLTLAILQERGYDCKSISMKPSSDSLDDNIKSKDELLKEAREKGVSYLINGDVTEWRYKSGVDHEPAVSLVLNVIDTKSSKVLDTSSLSESGWGGSSLGVVAQDMLNNHIK